MSHFIGLCFGEYWQSNLEQYDENLEVEPYVKYTKQEAIEEEKDRHLRRYDYAKRIPSDQNLLEENIQILLKGENLTDEEAWEAIKEWGYDIDEEENLLTTYNPDSKWDWYAVGGRWDGFLPLKEKDDNGNPICTNIACVNEIDWDYLFENKYAPFCFVTEDGYWEEKGEMGWWGITTNEQPKDEWEIKFKNYIQTLNPDCEVTVIDFHI